MIRLGSIILFILTVMACSTSNSQNISKVIDVGAFEKQMKSDKKVVVVDLRTDQEVVQGVIEGAIQIDYRSQDFKKKLEELDKSKTYMVYCAVGGRSGRAASLMNEIGFKEIYDLKGGMTAWKAEGKKVSQLKP
jgi:phage shock protein E